MSWCDTLYQSYNNPGVLAATAAMFWTPDGEGLLPTQIPSLLLLVGIATYSDLKLSWFSGISRRLQYL